MTPTSAIRRPSNPARGFTLLETLVVLALLGLAVALVAPAGYRMIASWQRATDAETILGALAALPDRARARGVDLHLPAGELAARPDLPLPEGWRLVLARPLSVRANGACSGTQGELWEGETFALGFALEAPYCRIRLGDG